MDSEFLKHFIQEPIYVIDKASSVKAPEPSSEVVQEETPISSIKPKVLKSKGENQKGIVILVSYDNVEIINSTDEQFLLKILGAVKLALSDVAIINLSDHDRNISLPDHSVCLNFNSKADQGESNLYEIQQNNGATTLSCDNLSVIASDTSKKKLLWTALQTLFLKG